MHHHGSLKHNEAVYRCLILQNVWHHILRHHVILALPCFATQRNIKGELTSTPLAASVLFRNSEMGRRRLDPSSMCLRKNLKATCIHQLKKINLKIFGSLHQFVTSGCKTEHAHSNTVITCLSKASWNRLLSWNLRIILISTLDALVFFYLIHNTLAFLGKRTRMSHRSSCKGDPWPLGPLSLSPARSLRNPYVKQPAVGQIIFNFAFACIACLCLLATYLTKHWMYFIETFRK